MGGLGTIDILISDLLCSSCDEIINTDTIESVTSYIKFDVTVDRPSAIPPLTLTLDVERLSWKRKKLGYYYAEALVRIDCPNCEKPHEIGRYLDAPVILLSNLGQCRSCNGQLSPVGEEVELVDEGEQSYISVRADMICDVCTHSEETKAHAPVGDPTELLGRGRIVLDLTSKNLQIDDKAKIRILFLSANPLDTGMPPLGLINEYKEISRELQLSPEGKSFECIQAHAVAVSELQSLLLQHEPHIVHFSGHGNDNGELVFENPEGHMEYASETAITNLLKILRGGIKCVFLNACYSEKQAASIAEHIDCVIGMSSEISDDAARQFALSFYRALGHSKNVKVAFDLACNQLDLASIPEAEIPKLVHKAQVDPTQIVILKD